jgi:predicted nucleic acid-binding protein
LTHLVDSDRFIDYFNDVGTLRERLLPLGRTGRLSTPIVVVAELYEGVVQSDDAETLLANMRRDLSAVRVLGLDDDIALRFASLRSTLRRQGQIIGDHDIWKIDAMN